MTTFLTWTNDTDKARWGDGPWVDEPDKCQWVDEATGLDCLAVRHPEHGQWCGYVGVPPGHEYHGIFRTDAYGLPLDVHGGITFADRCMEGLPEGHGVCHVPFKGRPADVWWLGFDCAHAFDLAPGREARMRELRVMYPDQVLDRLDAQIPESMRDVYRDLDYVRAETARLAAQLV